MKTTEEMVNSLFKRRERYYAERKNRLRGLVLACLLIAGVSAASLTAILMMNGGRRQVQSGNSMVTNSDRENIIWAENGVCIPDDNGFMEFEGKTVTYRFAEMIEASDGDETYAVLCHPTIDYDFVYKEKTIARYYSEMCDERILPQLLYELLKEGDYLKYGSAIYESGAPDGEKWSKQYYDERMEVYGSLIERYISDGEFDRDAVERDMAEAEKCRTAEKEFYRAIAAYLGHLAGTPLAARFHAGVAPDNGGIIMYMTADEFRAFTTEDIRGWTFDIASRTDGFTDT